MPEDSLFQSLYRFFDKFCSKSVIDSRSTPAEPLFALTNLNASQTNLFGMLKVLSYSICHPLMSCLMIKLV